MHFVWSLWICVTLSCYQRYQSVVTWSEIENHNCFSVGLVKRKQLALDVCSWFPHRLASRMHAGCAQKLCLRWTPQRDCFYRELQQHFNLSIPRFCQRLKSVPYYSTVILLVQVRSATVEFSSSVTLCIM